MKDREILEKEQAQMAKQIEIQKQQDIEAAAKKKARNEQMQKEVEAANKIAQVKKLEKIENEK